jgi:hypothetical protein
MNSVSTASRYRFFALLVVVSVLPACGERSEELADPDFVVTPVEGGQPQFLSTTEPEVAYPAPDVERAYPAPGDSGYPSSVPSTPGLDPAYPAPPPQHTVDGRALTTFDAYDLVEDIALEEFHPEAYLSAIVPSRIMLTNLGNPPVLPGWFYRFRRPESRREFIIQVVDDVVTGSTLTESAMDVSPPELPLVVDDLVIDSNEVLEMFEAVAAERGILEELIYDLELVDLEGGKGPTWSVVHPTTREWLYSINALTGEEAPNPYDR